MADLKFKIWQFFELAVSEKLKFEKKLYNATAVLERPWWYSRIEKLEKLLKMSVSGNL